MKAKCSRQGRPAHRVSDGQSCAAIGPAVLVATLALVAGATLLFAPGTALAQSPGLGTLRHAFDAQQGRGANEPGHAEPERGGQREARQGPGKLRPQREAADRGGRGQGGALTPDERRRLRQNLHDLSREMYQGG
jgi:hypothetical protein